MKPQTKKHLINILSTSALWFFCALSLPKANAQEADQGQNYRLYYHTRERCKLINLTAKNSHLVVGQNDTLPVYNIDTIINPNGTKDILCDCGKDYPSIIYDPYYYQNNFWLPIVQTVNVAGYEYNILAYLLEHIVADAKLVNAYYNAEHEGDYQTRDRIENLLLAHRDEMTRYLLSSQPQTERF